MNILNKRGIALLTVSALMSAGAGCELLVDFDRSKIGADAGIGDAAGVTDATLPSDSGMDQAVPGDAPAVDSGSEGSTPEAGMPEAGADTSTDTGAADTGTGTDAGKDTGPVDAGTEFLTITPTSNDFLTEDAGGSTADFTFTVKNSGALTSGTLSVAVSGTNAGDFQIEPGNTCMGMTLAPLATCIVKVFFMPSAASGTMETASLDVTASPVGTGSSVSAALTGTSN